MRSPRRTRRAPAAATRLRSGAWRRRRATAPAADAHTRLLTRGRPGRAPTGAARRSREAPALGSTARARPARRARRGTARRARSLRRSSRSAHRRASTPARPPACLPARPPVCLPARARGALRAAARAHHASRAQGARVAPVRRLARRELSAGRPPARPGARGGRLRRAPRAAGGDKCRRGRGRCPVGRRRRRRGRGRAT
jgi:hypothetical protein